jgi:hypothetical protein
MVLATRAEATLLRERGFRLTTIMEDTNEVRLLRRAAYGPTMRLEAPFHTYRQIMREVDSLAKAHPNLLEVLLIGTTTRNRQPIYAVRVGRGRASDGERPAILISGCHHSDELLGGEICLALLHDFTARSATDRQVS